uniref:Putative secreted protein n=1 Tax=Ixodes ricinus TaxID=34613 RepID=A0A6B0UKU8_IXORI
MLLVLVLLLLPLVCQVLLGAGVGPAPGLCPVHGRRLDSLGAPHGAHGAHHGPHLGAPTRVGRGSLGGCAVASLELLVPSHLPVLAAHGLVLLPLLQGNHASRSRSRGGGRGD